MIVVTGDYGQFGNRLIVFANMIATAREHGIRIANPAFHEYAGFFEATRRDVLCRYPAARVPLPGGNAARRTVHRTVLRMQRYAKKFHHRTGRWPPLLHVLDIGWRTPCNIDAEPFLHLARGRGILLTKGWLYRAQTTFQKHADAIRRFFTPVSTHRENVAATLDRVRHRAEVVVGVHIRHGDYKSYLGGRFFYEVDQYAWLMRQVCGLFAGRRVGFLVCSNASMPDGAFGDLDIAFGPGHVLEDMLSLAACDYVIGPPSTYTMWASFCGQVPLCTIANPERAPDMDDFRIVRDCMRTTRDWLTTPVAV